MKVTLQDIAEELNVSLATVSRSLRHSPSIHPETRARVTQTAIRLGYRGSSGRPRNTDRHTEKCALGLLVNGTSLADAQHQPIIVGVMEGVMAGADHYGFLLNIQTFPGHEEQHMDTDTAKVPSLISGKVCQAVILRGGHHPSNVAYIARTVPVVSLGRIYRDLKLDTVLYDDAEGIRSLVGRLISFGHRRLAWVDGNEETSFYEARQAGFVMGCLGGGLDLMQQQFIEQQGPGDHPAKRVLTAISKGVTAVVCANDYAAKVAVDLLEKNGLKVPEDVSVTGFDAVPTTISGGRQITSIDPHFREIGLAAVRLAALRLEQPSTPPQTLIVQGSVVPGDTIGSVKSK
jgi:LacI family transcriptional regulator